MPGRSSAHKYGFHPGAGIEFVDESEYLRAENREVAERFEAAVTHAIERVLEHPKIGRVIRESEGVVFRKWRVQRFRYSLVYTVIGDEVRIYAVAHHSRRSGYWLHRARSL